MVWTTETEDRQKDGGAGMIRVKACEECGNREQAEWSEMDHQWKCGSCLELEKTLPPDENEEQREEMV